MSQQQREDEAMPYVLSDAEVEQMHRDGYVCPIDVLDESEALALRSELEAVETRLGGPLSGHQRNKTHLLLKWLDDLIRDARVLDPLEQILGPNILCWNTIFWTKEAGSNSFVSWHQDTRYWGLSSDNVMTAWLALSPASIDSGCMRVMPGTHLGDVLPHEDRYHQDNMLTRGQEISKGVDEDVAVFMPLKTGQMSIHNYRIAHASGPNLSPDRRIGISMHFMPTETKQIVGDWDTAALVRGRDDYGYFRPTMSPAADFDDEAVEFHAAATAQLSKVLYEGATQNTAKL
ncbi:MAG: phytanoyl-CoA dioxygenase family protein [Pseudomonadota bacterium]